MEHREHLRNAVSIPIALLTILGAAIAYLSKDFQFPHGLLGWWFTLAGMGALLAFGMATFFLIRCYHGHTYERIPFPRRIKEYEDGVRRHFGDTDQGRAQAASHFEGFLRDCHTKAADRNAETNFKRSAYLYRANAAIIVSFVLVALAFIPHIATQRLASADKSVRREETTNARRTRDSTTAATPAPAAPRPTTEHRVP